MSNNPKRKEHELVVQEIKGELLIYDLKTNKQFYLNSTSTLIWNLCDGSRSVSDIGKELSRKMKQPVTDELVRVALDQLLKNDLLAEDLKIEFAEGLSRRQAIKKLGLTTSLALPAVAFIVVPTPTQTASCIPDNSSFTLNSTDTNDCFAPANFNRCCTKSIKFTATDGVSKVMCTCGIVVVP